MQFLYLGFSQQANIRSYRFQGVVPRERPSKIEKNLEFMLRADMAVLAQHSVRVQDGPTLCLKILTAAFTSAEDSALRFATYAITFEDVSTFARARDALYESKMVHRKHQPPFKPSRA